MSNVTNKVWKNKLQEVTFDYDYLVKPRGMRVKEKQPGSYSVPMPAYISLVSRKVNRSFMFAEAWWILSGSNRVSDITPYMTYYKKFSDDGVFLRGAYGPKITDQLGYVVDTLNYDKDTRQAVLNIWRERPGESKDIPCTISMQFFIRNNKLNLVTTMRSNDIVLGFTYDVFTFSMVAKAVQLLLAERNTLVELGTLTVNAGSLHIYETHWNKTEEWVLDDKKDDELIQAVESLEYTPTFDYLLENLKQLADQFNEN